MKKAERVKFFGVPKLAPFLKAYRRRIFAMIACGLLGSAIDVAIPIFQRYSLNHFVGGNTLDTLPYFIALFVVVVLLSALANYVAMKFAFCTEVEINRDLRNAVFSRLQTLGLSYYNTNSVGYIHSRVMSDTSRIGSLVSWTLMDSVWHLSYIVGSVVVMLAINWRLALLVMVVLPVTAAMFAIMQGKMVRGNRQVREMNSIITSDFNEGITGAKTIKTLVIQSQMHGAFRRDSAGIRRKSMYVAHLRGLFGATINFASSVALAIVLWRGGYIAESEVGTFSLFMSYAQGMIEPMRWVIDAISDLVTCQVNIERVDKILHTRPDVVDSPEVVALYGDQFAPKYEAFEPMHGDIQIKDVTFHYPDGTRNVLEHFSLDIPFGSNVAIVGETGAGKSTLVNLICRFYDVDEGQILIDGKDIRTRSQNWLHSNVGYVLQTPHLFSGTVRQNLLYGNPNATDEDIARALELVSATSVVAKLEHGIDSDVGEGGDLLSTGEKQLLSFARAILCDPRLLVLDEATASVDTLTEARIQSAIDRVIAGRTSIVIAHRLSTVKNADCILVVKDGRIVERGTHQELLALNGYYRQLYVRQYEDEKTKDILG